MFFGFFFICIENYFYFVGKPGTSAIQNTETEIPSNQITLTWSAAPENGAKILTYTVWWRQVEIGGGVGEWSFHNTSSDALSFKVTCLEFGRTYDFGVTAWNSYGQGPRNDENGLKRIKVLPIGKCSTSVVREFH